VWRGVWLRLAGRSGRPRVSRRVVRLICGGWVPQDLVSSHVRCLQTSAAAGAVAHSPKRGLVCASAGGPGRLASRHGLWWGWLVG
jgi:hypothetical protein